MVRSSSTRGSERWDVLLFALFSATTRISRPVSSPFAPKYVVVPFQTTSEGLRSRFLTRERNPRNLYTATETLL